MKKFLILIMAIILALPISAKTEYGFRQYSFFENTFVGGGLGASWFSDSRDHAFWRNLCPEAYLRAGKYVNPNVGVQVRINSGVNRGYKTFVDYSNLGVDGLLNLTNAFCGYEGRPRTFEVVGVLGSGWFHTYGNVSNNIALTAGFQFNFNVGHKKAWQINIIPSYTYTESKPIDNSIVNLSVGVTYNFADRDGNHYMKYSQIIDPLLFDDMNNNINKLREENCKLKKELEERPDIIINKVVRVDTVYNDEFTNAISFKIGQSKIDESQYVSLSKLASYIDKTNTNIVIYGYSDADTGSDERNMELSKERAESVRDTLVNEFGVNPNNIEVKWLGSSEQPFNKNNFNRVVIFKRN